MLAGRLKSIVLQLPMSTSQHCTIPYNLLPSLQYKYISTTTEYFQSKSQSIHYEGISFSVSWNLSRKGQQGTRTNEEPQKGTSAYERLPGLGEARTHCPSSLQVMQRSVVEPQPADPPVWAQEICGFCGQRTLPVVVQLCQVAQNDGAQTCCPSLALGLLLYAGGIGPELSITSWLAPHVRLQPTS